MATVQRYNGGQVPLVQTQIRPLTGQVVGNGENPIAGALAGVGQQVAEISATVAKANDARSLLEANNSMQDELVSFGQWQQENQDEKQWLPEWQRRMQGLGERFGKAPLTPPGRMRLAGMMSEWGGRQTMQVQGQAIKQTGQRAMDAASLTLAKAEESRDLTTAHAAWDELQRGGVVTPERAELGKFQAGEKINTLHRQDATHYASALVERGLYDDAVQEIQDAPFTPAEKADQIAKLQTQREVVSLVTMANDDPQKAIEQARASNILSGPDRVRVVNAAETRMDSLRSDSLKSYAEEIKLGTPDKGSLINKINGNTFLKDADRRALFQYIATGPVNDPGAYADLWTAAKTFEGQEGTPDYSRLVSRIDMALDGEQKSSVLSQLGATVKGPKDGQTRAYNEVYSLVEQDRKSGVFGTLTGRLNDPKTVLPQDVRSEVDAYKTKVEAQKGALWWKENKSSDEVEIEARQEWWKANHPTDKELKGFSMEVVEDSSNSRQSTTRSMGVIANLDRWRADNSKATPEQFRAYYEGLVPAQRAASGYVSPLLPTNEVPRVDLNDLLKRNATNPRK